MPAPLYSALESFEGMAAHGGPFIASGGSCRARRAAAAAQGRGWRPRSVRRMAGIEARAENICSLRVLRILTQSAPFCDGLEAELPALAPQSQFTLRLPPPTEPVH